MSYISVTTEVVYGTCDAYKMAKVKINGVENILTFELAEQLVKELQDVLGG